jgi:beta-xylosidase
MNFRRICKKATAGALSLAMVMGLAGCGAASETAAETASEAVSAEETDLKEGDMDYVVGFSETRQDITVTLATDKASYEEGDVISYVLHLENNNPGLTVVSSKFAYSCSEELMPATDEDLPTLVPRLRNGEKADLTGELTRNDGSRKCPADTSNTASGEYVTIRPYVQVPYGDDTVTVRMVLNLKVVQVVETFDSSDVRTFKTVACHDPSIIVGEDPEGQKCYYIFGSHRAWAKSYDLQNWTYFENNLSKDYANILAEPAAWSAHGSKTYRVDGYMWAPDMIYNKDMGKWCMYLSVDGDNWYSSIVLLTADTIEGDWTYEGIVVYSGFHSDEYYDETDVAEVTGETEYPERYAKGKQWGDYYPNNIDACVFYDDDGNLWMTYGSWSGGIYMLALDEKTGFRDKDVTYETGKHSDAYFGKLIAGGCYVSGEASYIQKIGDYYWLFMSYGALEARGGYNIRVFRSETPDGDYVDELGNTPYFDVYQKNHNMSVGVRLFGGYQWRTFNYGQVAQGHNSAFVDDDGKAYIVFHTRTSDGSEAHYVKVHQLFVNKNGWLVAAPYQTVGETLNESGYSVADVAGTYGVILHKIDIDYANLETVKPVNVELKEDGTITGGYEGTWSLEPGTPYIDLTIDGVTYSGVTLKMDVEGSKIETMTFTALGDSNQLTLWGSKAID